MRKFITHKGMVEGPDIEAIDHAHAATIAADIDPELIVDGESRLTIKSDAMTDDIADNMIRAMAEENI